MARINHRSNASIRVIRLTISEDAVSLRALLVIRFGNHLLPLISTYSESVPISDHQWLKTPWFGHSVAASPRWAIRGQPGLKYLRHVSSAQNSSKAAPQIIGTLYIDQPRMTQRERILGDILSLVARLA
jgi:hypothetical protein